VITVLPVVELEVGLEHLISWFRLGLSPLMLVLPVLVVPPVTMLAVWVLVRVSVQLWLLLVAVVAAEPRIQPEMELPVAVVVVLVRLVDLASQYLQQ
jgi:hypothetical protein